MPITVTEILSSRRVELGEQSSAELHYSIEGTTSDTDAQSALVAFAPAAYPTGGGLLLRESLLVEPTEAPGVWGGYVRFTSRPDDTAGRFSFDSTGGTAHITQSIITTNSAIRQGGPYTVIPNFSRAIGVTNDGVDGVDIVVPKCNFSEQYVFNAFDWDYRRRVIQLTGTVNNAAFRGWRKGEVLFLGATGAFRQDNKFDVTFNFAVSEGVYGPLEIAPGLVIPGTPDSPAKYGWEYVWVQYLTDVDTSAHALVRMPVVAMVEQVYPYGDFRLLGIGTAA